MSTPLLSVTNLEVRYGDLIGVADVSLEVPKGSIVALLGSNGAVARGLALVRAAERGEQSAARGNVGVGEVARSPATGTRLYGFSATRRTAAPTGGYHVRR